ncbi:kinase [Bacillus sp. DNRA2]|uniref:kinase-associated lipoprotein B n=1 Tax=Bacillus sp. DNRA2 TaxID=2723053 RepID=UPI00145D302B|nr:kinase-associated lipoprotein B [Bacillus sp. DNRA2]NMD69035.1 kinase [Bacillus sp. DNRA2]
MSEIQVGDHVTAIYKTGKYIGEVTDIRPQAYLVRVLAVAKHPMQGDLHSPKDADVGFFHQRRALAFREQANIPKQMVKPYDAEIPDYVESLKEAVARMKQELTEMGTPWAEQSLKLVEELAGDYFR